MVRVGFQQNQNGPRLADGRRRRGVRATYLLPFGYPIFRSGLGGLGLVRAIGFAPVTTPHTGVPERRRPAVSLRTRPRSESGQSTVLVTAMSVHAGDVRGVGRRRRADGEPAGGPATGRRRRRVYGRHRPGRAAQSLRVLEPAGAERLQERVGHQPGLSIQRMLVGGRCRQLVLLRQQRHGASHYQFHQQGLRRGPEPQRLQRRRPVSGRAQQLRLLDQCAG